MSRSRDDGPITVAIPIEAVLAVRSSARMSRDGISDDYEGYRHKGREYEDLARRRAAEVAELDELLRQLGDTEDQEARSAPTTTRCTESWATCSWKPSSG